MTQQSVRLQLCELSDCPLNYTKLCHRSERGLLESTTGMKDQKVPLMIAPPVLVQEEKEEEEGKTGWRAAAPACPSIWGWGVCEWSSSPCVLFKPSSHMGAEWVMDVAVCFIVDEKPGWVLEEEVKERMGGGGVSSKSRMAAGGSRGERARPCLAGCSVKRVEIERKQKKRMSKWRMKREIIKMRRPQGINSQMYHLIAWDAVRKISNFWWNIPLEKKKLKRKKQQTKHKIKQYKKRKVSQQPEYP